MVRLGEMHGHSDEEVTGSYSLLLLVLLKAKLDL